MKLWKNWILVVALLAGSWLAPAHAAPVPDFKADPLKGVYNVLAQNPGAAPANLAFIVDTDTLLNIWNKYGDGGPLPDNLVPQQNAPSIIAGLTQGGAVILTLEANATVTPNYLHIFGNGSEMELIRQPNGQFALGVLQNQVITRYTLAAPQPLQ